MRFNFIGYFKTYQIKTKWQQLINLKIWKFGNYQDF